MGNITGKKPSQLKDPTGAVDNSGWLVFEIGNGDVVRIHPNQLPGGSSSQVHLNDETGDNAPDNPAAPDNPPAGAAAGDTLIEFYDDQVLYWSYDGTNWTLEFSQILATESIYHGGNGGYVRADGANVSYAKAPGLGTFTIPAGELMKSFRVYGNAADLNNGELRLVFIGGRGSGTDYNTSDQDLYHPTITVTNRTKVLPADPELQRPDDAGDSIDIFEEAFQVNGQCSVKITGLAGDFEIKGQF